LRREQRQLPSSRDISSAPFGGGTFHGLDYVHMGDTIVEIGDRRIAIGAIENPGTESTAKRYYLRISIIGTVHRGIGIVARGWARFRGVAYFSC